MDDDAMIALLEQRSDRAVDALAQQFGKRLYLTALNLLGNSRDAEECVNDCYLAIWNAIPPAHPENLAAYVYRTGRNIALNRIRDTAPQKAEVPLDELSAYLCAPSREDSRLLGQFLNRWLDSQNRVNRISFLRRYWFGDSVKEIAQTLKMKENAVSARLKRCRDSLKAYLIKEGYYG